MVTTDAPPVPITAKVSDTQIGGDYYAFKMIIMQSIHITKDALRPVLLSEF